MSAATAPAGLAQPPLDPASVEPEASALCAKLARALDAAPLDVVLHAQMRGALHVAGDAVGFAAHQLAVVAFGMLDGAPDPQRALALYNLAAVKSMRAGIAGVPTACNACSSNRRSITRPAAC